MSTHKAGEHHSVSRSGTPVKAVNLESSSSRRDMPDVVLNVWPLVVTRPAVGDLERFLRAVESSRELHGRWVSPPANAAEFDRYLRHSEKKSRESFFVRHQTDNALVGVVNVRGLESVDDSARISFYVFSQHSRKGLMLKAVQTIVDHLFETRLHLDELVAHILPANYVSQQFAKKLGFMRRGRTVRVVLTDLCEHEFQEWVKKRCE